MCVCERKRERESMRLVREGIRRRISDLTWSGPYMAALHSVLHNRGPLWAVSAVSARFSPGTAEATFRTSTGRARAGVERRTAAGQALRTHERKLRAWGLQVGEAKK